MGIDARDILHGGRAGRQKWRRKTEQRYAVFDRVNVGHAPREGAARHLLHHKWSIDQVAVNTISAADNGLAAGERLVGKSHARLDVVLLKIDQGTGWVTSLGSRDDGYVFGVERVDVTGARVGDHQRAASWIEAIQRAGLAE